MKIIDTHCHLDSKLYDDDLDDVIQNALKKGVGKIIIPSADPKDLEKAIKISEKYSHIFFAVGCHPYHCDEFDLEFLKKYVNHPKCVAIGECGLDYYRLPKDEIQKEKNMKLQKEVFISQIKLAKSISKPIIIHIRESSVDSKNIILNYGNDLKGVLHCFNADDILLDLSNNFYFGIGGVVTFKNATNLVNILNKIPQDKIVIETDSPYLTPQPYRGKRNEPSYTNLIIEKISNVLDLTKDEVIALTTKNSIRLFKELM